MAQVLLSNDKEPVGVVLVTLPIPDGEYAKSVGDLRELGIGDVTARDCYIDQIMDAPPVLDCPEGQTVNIDELDFLFRSIDRFTDDELAGFQAMAAKREITDIEELIDLSCYCERATVITAFRAAVGAKLREGRFWAFDPNRKKNRIEKLTPNEREMVFDVLDSLLRHTSENR